MLIKQFIAATATNLRKINVFFYNCSPLNTPFEGNFSVVNFNTKNMLGTLKNIFLAIYKT